MEEEKWAVAHLSPRRKASASPRHSRLRKFYSRAEGHMLCRAVAVLAESHVVAVLAIPSPRAAPRRPCRPVCILAESSDAPSSPSTSLSSPSGRRHQVAGVTKRPSASPSWPRRGHPSPSVVPSPSWKLPASKLRARPQQASWNQRVE